ncbi:hypothetical protein CSUI_009511 [Cystoisospora suis]|uniref:Uncharacterized protein n=1 Tax=Cystoisospora suis TaxID=483139 RepID=A0A2C6KJY2_9APIC|nr:hypothetical protein CSUI_009511 [Cystoisospora suis]
MIQTSFLPLLIKECKRSHFFFRMFSLITRPSLRLLLSLSLLLLVRLSISFNWKRERKRKKAIFSSFFVVGVKAPS